MSREVLRVPLDFDWPLDKVWHGYLFPGELSLQTCPDCNGSGWSGAGKWLQTLCYRLAMLVEDVRRAQPRGEHMHPWLAQDPYPPTREVTRPVTADEQARARAEIDRCEAEGRGARGYLYHLAKDGARTTDRYEVIRPSADIVDLVAGLTGLAPDRMGRMLGLGTSEAYRMARKIAEAAGVDPDTWGMCSTCAGQGDVGTPEQRAAAEAWERTEPPTGEGWQLWETVSEGSPISPVFAEREVFIRWLTTDYSWGAQQTPLTREQAEAFVGLGHSIGSGVITGDGRMISGEAAVALLANRT